MPGFEYVPYNDIAALEETIARLDADSRHVAAILLEALQGEGGVRPGDIAYFQRIRDICRAPESEPAVFSPPLLYQFR